MSCSDGIRNGNEEGSDCGGPNCLPCTLLKSPMPPSQPTSGSSQSLVQWIILSACIMGLVIIVAVVVLRRARSRGAAKSAGAVGSSSISAAARSKTHGRRKKSGKGRASVTVAPAPPSHDEDERPHEGLTLQAEWEESGCLSTRAQRSGFLQKSSGSPRPSSRAVSAASTAPAVMQASPRKPGLGQVAGTSGGRLPPLSSPQAASTVSSGGAGGAKGKRHGGAQPAESLRLHSRAMVSQSPHMSPAPRRTSIHERPGRTQTLRAQLEVQDWARGDPEFPQKGCI